MGITTTTTCDSCLVDMPTATLGDAMNVAWLDGDTVSPPQQRYYGVHCGCQAAIRAVIEAKIVDIRG